MGVEVQFLKPKSSFWTHGINSDDKKMEFSIAIGTWEEYPSFECP